jgi:hypothetical protein
MLALLEHYDLNKLRGLARLARPSADRLDSS